MFFLPKCSLNAHVPFIFLYFYQTFYMLNSPYPWHNFEFNGKFCVYEDYSLRIETRRKDMLYIYAYMEVRDGIYTYTYIKPDENM